VRLKRLRELAGRRWVSALLHVAALLGAWLAIGAYQTRRHLASDAAPAPAFELQSLDGRRVSLEEFRGRRVLVHFFATWCGVCKLELPSLRSLHSGLEGEGDAVLLAVVEDSDDIEAVRRFAREHELRYPILLGTAPVIAAYRVGAYPTNYYLRPDGSISSSSVGLSTRLGMSARLALAGVW
jgi:peroxiredoxin